MKLNAFLILVVPFFFCSSLSSILEINSSMELKKSRITYSNRITSKATLRKTKTYTIQANAEDVQAFFVDLIQFGELHPLIQRIDKLDSLEEGSLYNIHEKPFNWLPIKVNYKAKVKAVDNTIEYHLFDMPATTVDMNYIFTEEEKGVAKVDFSIDVHGKVGKKMLMRKMFSAQDQIMLDVEKSLK